MSNQIGSDLVSSLIDGPFEQPLWGTFLNLLRQKTQADHAALNFRSPDKRYEDMIILISGANDAFSVGEIYLDNFYPKPLPFNEELPENKPYSKLTWLNALDPAMREVTERILTVNGISGFRELHIREPSGIHAWLNITRLNGDFDPKAERLLESLSHALRGTFRSFIALERERYKSSVTADATRRLKFGWLALDRQGKVVDGDREGAAILESSDDIGTNRQGKLTARTSKLERRIRAAIHDIADNPQARPSAITVSQDPWLDMLLLRAEGRSISATGKAEVIAYVHGDSWSVSDRAAQLADLFALTPREADLTLAFCRGMSIAEAAVQFGLTLETTRNYSKAIYAKTGARGMSDLIRLIMRSILAFSPN